MSFGDLVFDKSRSIFGLLSLLAALGCVKRVNSVGTAPSQVEPLSGPNCYSKKHPLDERLDSDFNYPACLAKCWCAQLASVGLKVDNCEEIYIEAYIEAAKQQGEVKQTRTTTVSSSRVGTSTVTIVHTLTCLDSIEARTNPEICREPAPPTKNH